MWVAWNGRRVTCPGWALAPGSTLVATAHAVPVGKVGDPFGGMLLEPSPTKVVRMLLADGPRRTAIKVRNKLMQRRQLGDYRATLVLGHRDPDGATVIALAPQAPPDAEWFLVPDELIVVVGAGWDRRRLVAVSARLQRAGFDLDRLADERFLYSANPPPAAAAHALRQAVGEVPPPGGPALRRSRPPTLVTFGKAAEDGGATPLAMLGCGDYASTETLADLQHNERFTPWIVADREPHVAAAKAVRHGFVHATTDAGEAIDALPRPGVVMVATAHDSHARLAAQAAAAGHTVFVEKPPVITTEDLEILLAAWRAAPGRIEVGYNRRFAPATAALVRALGPDEGPLSIASIVREVPLAPRHWFHWPNQGTRIAGNACHWLDLAAHLLPLGTLPLEVSVSCGLPAKAGEDRTMTDRTICVTYDDGSFASILATERGDAMLGVQERIEVRRAGRTFEIDDFRRVRELSRGRRRALARGAFRDKGHREMYRTFADDVALGRPARYPIRDLITVSELQIAATGLLRQGGGQAAIGPTVARRLTEAGAETATPAV